MKRILAGFITALLLVTVLSGCNSGHKTDVDHNLPTIDTLEVGKDYTDLSASITVLTFRTDIMDKLEGYAQEFSKKYPGIKIVYQGVTDYETSAIVYLSSGTDWGDIMMIPLGIEKDTVSEYFIPLGKKTVLDEKYNFTSAWNYNDDVYGLASTGNANGILYNKKVFNDAGIADLPKTPDEFLKALKSIKDSTDAIPLYTNYADEWPMSSWDAYAGINATGQDNYWNQVLVHASDPFNDPGDGTGPYSVYKILYDAVSNGLTEDDYATTSEPLSYQMLNEGQIGCLIFSSWAVVQAQDAGSHPEDVGFMSFPITVNGKQYVSINGDYSYGINKNSSEEEIIASMLYVKWLVEESGYSYSEGGLSVYKPGDNPDFYDSLKDCVILEDVPGIPGEELLFNQLNTESGLLFNANGNAKVQSIVEHAFKKDRSFDSIMEEWNKAWSDAQKKLGVDTE